MSKYAILKIILIWQVLLLTSCHKNEKRSSGKDISIMRSVPDDCSPFIKIDSSGYHYYKCFCWNSDDATHSIDISNEEIINIIEKMSIEDWNRLSLNSSQNCKVSTKNVFIVEIRENNKSQSFMIDERFFCNDKYNFFNELNFFFLKMKFKWW